MIQVNKVLSLVAPLLMVGSLATPVAAGETVLSGSIACPATYFTRKGGTEIHDRSYGIRNFNNNSTVTINRVRAWDNDGTLAFDDLPSNSGFKSVLAPHVSAIFSASHVLPDGTVPPNNVQQIQIDYTLDKPGMPVHIGFSHVTRGLDGYQTTRQGGKCFNVSPRAKARAMSH